MSTHRRPQSFPTNAQHLLEVQTFITNLETLNEKMETLVGWADQKFGAAERTRSRALLVSAAAQQRVLTIVKRANVVQARMMDDADKETLAALETDLGEVEEELVKLIGELGELLNVE